MLVLDTGNCSIMVYPVWMNKVIVLLTHNLRFKHMKPNIKLQKKNIYRPGPLDQWFCYSLTRQWRYIDFTTDRKIFLYGLETGNQRTVRNLTSQLNTIVPNFKSLPARRHSTFASTYCGDIAQRSYVVIRLFQNLLL